MIKFDFFTYTQKYISKQKLADFLDKKPQVLNKFKSSNMIGWTKKPPTEIIEKIKLFSNKIRNNSDLLVVVGIGGSFLGSCAYHNIFKDYFNDKSFEVLYAGTTLSSKYLKELTSYLEDKDFTLNVISKSGTTLETILTYKVLKELLKNKYTSAEVEERIIITTTKDSSLTKEINSDQILEIPSDIGGRYSFLTSAHLLALSLNYDIDKIITYYMKGLNLTDEAYTYACIRNLLYKRGYYVENFAIYEEKLAYFTEWLKQLFAESEGKNSKGILPISTINTRDLHSLGQFIQDGNKIIFETFIKIINSDSLLIEGKNWHDINNIVESSVIKAHSSGNVPCNIIELDYLNQENVSMLISFFELSAAFSAYLFEVEPFNQPGVEIYKKEMQENLK